MIEECVQQENVFDEVFRNTEAESLQGLDGLSELIYQTEREAAQKAEVGGNNVIPYRPRRWKKKKVTYYLTEKVVVELCEAKAKIRVLVPPDLKTKVSMSRIVDYAVNAILDEFNSIGKKSELVKRIISGK